MLFKIDAINTMHTTYEVNALTEDEAKDVVFGEDSQRFIVENKNVMTKIKSVNGTYTQSDMYYDDKYYDNF